MAHVILMDHVTVTLAGPESYAIKKRVPLIVLRMADVIYKQPSVSVVIPIPVSILRTKLTTITKACVNVVCVVCACVYIWVRSHTHNMHENLYFFVVCIVICSMFV